MLSFDDISYAYGAAGDRRALDGVSLLVHPGELIAVVGANGSGKSTLARLANGILVPQSGVVMVDGVDTRDADRLREVREHVAIVFQHPDDQIVATSVEDDVAFGPENLGLMRGEIRRRVDDALASVGLTGLERREPHTLSGGQKQRLAIAGALAMHPAFLVFDEPTSMLDPVGRIEVLRIVERLRAEGRGIVHITHELADVISADRVLVLDGGRPAFSGTPSELLGRADVLDACGLELPALQRFARELVARGARLPEGDLSPEMLAGALWG